ncbi:MAG: FxLYD domain-containing protein [Phycisphaerales bacterium]|nr:FxLYD domain-containing protein [Phycisphaerales bacterium]
MRTRPASTLLLLTVALMAAPAAGDWLVTRDGSRIETKGAWKVAGRQVVFTQPNGTLSALRLDEVDLDLSAVETQRALVVASTPPPPVLNREPVLRLTERDLPPVKDEEESVEPKEKEAAGKAVSSGLEVASWERATTSAGDGVEIFGTVKNAGTSTVTSPTLMVTLYDAEGRLIATAEGRVNAPAVPRGQTASFRAVFPGVDDFAAARFDAQGTPFATREQGQAEEGGELEEAAPAPEAPSETTPPPVA